MKYKAFISYRHSSLGRAHAQDLEQALKRYAKPLLKPPIKIFRDEKHMVPDNDLSALITSGLEHSEYLIFLAEKGSASSKWCRDELEYWCGTLGRKDNLIIVYLNDEIKLDLETGTINWEKTNALPSILQKYIQKIPLYIDLSWATRDEDRDLQNPSYKKTINLLTAKLRGVTPEEINDEEIRVFRKNRRLRNGAIGVLSVLLLISLLTTWWALDRTEYAQDRQAFAETQQQIAQDRATEAQEQRSIAQMNAQMARDSAIYARQQENIAKEQRDIANFQRVRAERATQEALRKAESSRLTTLALSILPTDPSKALRLAEQAVKIAPDNTSAIQVLHDIISNPSHIFYSDYFSIHHQPPKLEGVSWPEDVLLGQWTSDTSYMVRAVGHHSNTILNFPENIRVPKTRRKKPFPLKTKSYWILEFPKDIFSWNSKGQFYRHYALESEITYLDASSDGDRLLVSHSGATLLIDLVQDRVVSIENVFYDPTNFENPQEPRAVFSPDGQYVLTFGDNRTAKLWETKKLMKSKTTWDAHPELTIEDADNELKDALFSPDNQYIFSFSSSGKAKLWDLNNGQKKKVIAKPHITFTGMEGDFSAADISPNGNYILSGGSNEVVKLWNKEGHLLKELNVSSGKYKGDIIIGSLSVKFLWGGRFILAGTFDQFKIWNIDGVLLREANISQEAFPQSVGEGRNYAFFLYGNKFTAHALHNTLIKTFKASEDLLFRAPRPTSAGLLEPPSPENLLTAPTISPDGQYIAAYCGNGKIYIWNNNTTLKCEIPFLKDDDDDYSIFYPNTLRFSADGTSLIAGTKEGKLMWWNLAGELIREVQVFEAPFFLFSLSSNTGQMLGFDGNLKLLNKYGEVIRQWKNETQPPTTGRPALGGNVALSPDGNFALTGYNSGSNPADARVALLNAQTGALIKTFPFSGKIPIAIACSPDNQWILAGNTTGQVYLWKITGETVLSVRAHAGSVVSLEFSPDGSHFLSCGTDGKTKLWNLDGTLLQTIPNGQIFGPTGGEQNQFPYSATFTPDGTAILTSDLDGTLKLWQTIDAFLRSDRLAKFTAEDKVRFGLPGN